MLPVIFSVASSIITNLSGNTPTYSVPLPADTFGTVAIAFCAVNVPTGTDDAPSASAATNNAGRSRLVLMLDPLAVMERPGRSCASPSGRRHTWWSSRGHDSADPAPAPASSSRYGSRTD